MLQSRFIIISTFLIISCKSNSQDYGELEYLLSLPKHINECSGISLASEKDHLFLINDSGNEPILHNLNLTTSTTVQKNFPKGITNVDWEDLAYKNDTIFIGDFGNNANKRKDLKIYWIPPGKTENTLETTNFKLQDQHEFPPSKKQLNFDIEAFIYFQNHFYLFSRNRSKDFDGLVKVYRLPALPGNQQTELIDTFVPCEDPRDCQITGAAIHQPSKKIALLSYNKVWILKDFNSDKFFSGSIQKIKLNHYSQKESICFKDEYTLYISEEKSRKSQGNLYLLDLEKD